VLAWFAHEGWPEREAAEVGALRATIVAGIREMLTPQQRRAAGLQ
jgi:hypothetical protein